MPSSFYTIITHSDLGELKPGQKSNVLKQLEVNARMYSTVVNIRAQSEWVMLVDTDEFVTSRARPDMTIKQLLISEFSDCGIITIPWLQFSWGARIKTPANSARYNLYDRWGYDDKYALPSVDRIANVNRKFGNINEGVVGKIIVNTNKVFNLHHVHEANFFNPLTRQFNEDYICISHARPIMDCAEQVARELVTTNVHEAALSRFYQSNVQCTRLELPPNCPLLTRMHAPGSVMYNRLREADVPHMLLSTFHYQVKSEEDYYRLMNYSRLFSRQYSMYRGILHVVNRTDVVDDFMYTTRRPRRANHPEYLRAQQTFSKCPASYYSVS